MLQIALLLFGAQFVRDKAKYLWISGLLWGIAGVLIFIDGFDGQTYFPLKTFGIVLLLESLITLSVAASGIGAQKAVLYFKGGVFFFVSLIMLVDARYSNILLSVIFGFSYFVIGLFVIASAWVVRFPRWRASLIMGCLQIAFAGFLITHSSATVSFFLGVLMIAGSINTLRVAMRARQLKNATSVFQLMVPREFAKGFTTKVKGSPAPEKVAETVTPPLAFTSPLTVHIWPPEGSASEPAVPRPVINRYIAAVDAHGVISTGHAALEASPHVYVSLYPAEDIDRSPSEFFRLLKATHDNDIAGKYQPDYVTESGNWCHSDKKIHFHGFNGEALHRFWTNYRKDEIYNLTYRNCSSSVAYSLEAALDGVLANRRGNWLTTLKVLFMPELWIASQVRKRALTMAWTPGLVMDYARALRAIVHPVPQPWYKRMPWKWRSTARDQAS